MPISPTSVICLQPYTPAVLWLSKLAWSVVPLAGKSFQPGWTDKMNTQIVPTSVILSCLSGWAVSQAIITVVHTQMTCPLTKAESVDDKLNKTGERLLTELRILWMSQVKAEMQFGKVQTELFLGVCSFEVFTGICLQTINGLTCNELGSSLL